MYHGQVNWKGRCAQPMSLTYWITTQGACTGSQQLLTEILQVAKKGKASRVQSKTLAYTVPDRWAGLSLEISLVLFFSPTFCLNA
jgi:hypothetical protein